MVAQEDQLASAKPHRLREVLPIPENSVIPVDINNERCIFLERLQDLDRGIGGAVVTDHEFIGLDGLMHEAIQLLPEVCGPVVGRHGDGDIHWIPRTGLDDRTTVFRAENFLRSHEGNFTWVAALASSAWSAIGVDTTRRRAGRPESPQA